MAELALELASRGHVQRDAGHPDGFAERVADDPALGDDLHGLRPGGTHPALGQVLVVGRRRPLEGLAERLAIVGVDELDERLVGPGERAMRDPDDLLEALRPADDPRRHVPVPRAHPTGRQGKGESLLALAQRVLGGVPLADVAEDDRRPRLLSQAEVGDRRFGPEPAAVGTCRLELDRASLGSTIALGGPGRRDRPAGP